MRQIGQTWVRDTLQELTAPGSTALVVVDLQNDFCHRDGHFARYGKDIAATEAMLPRCIALVRAAQAAGVPVVFIKQKTLPNGLSDSPAWLRFKTRDGKSPEYTLVGSWGAELVDGLAPGPRDLVVEKLRPDAFHKTELDLVLRANGIESVVIIGTTTEGCVESTVRSASYHDYYVVVVSDCVASPNPANHDGSMRLYAARYPLTTAAEITAAWQNASGKDQAAE